MLLVFVLLAAASLMPLDLTTDLSVRGQGPSPTHLLGTDQLGRDVAALTLRGIRNSAMVGVSAALASAAIGLAIGVAMGLGPRLADEVGMRLVEITDTVPTLLLAILVTALLGPSPAAIVVTIAVTHWSRLARIIRADLLSFRHRDWVTASITMGASRWHVAREHVLPAVAGQVGVAVVLAIPGAIGHEATLSFLGLGYPPDNPSLGTMVADAPAALIEGHGWPVIAPSVALVLLCLVGIMHLIGTRRPVALEQPCAPIPAVSPPPGAAVVTVSQLRVRRGESKVLRDVELVLRRGEFAVLLGESGAGKSTVLQAMVGVLPGPALVEGSITYHGADAPIELLGLPRDRRRAWAKRVSLVSQSAQTALPPTTRLHRSLARAARSRGSVDGLLERVGLAPELAGRYPHQLSGGQSRRALLALALAGQPEVLLVDEPTVGLDTDAATRVLELLRRECDRGISVLVTTHAADLVLPWADRVLALADGRVSPMTWPGQDPHHAPAAADRGAHA